MRGEPGAEREIERRRLAGAQVLFAADHTFRNAELSAFACFMYQLCQAVVLPCRWTLYSCLLHGRIPKVSSRLSYLEMLSK